MAVREVIEIDEELCDGCGDCVTACAEGAIEIIDGKARLVSDVYCDGLGACLGHCPQGALTVIEREADSFDEEAVEHRLATLRPESPAGDRPMMQVVAQPVATGGGCPGSRAQMHEPAASSSPFVPGNGPASQLRHWPVQLHLVPPTAPFFQDADVVLAADCVAFAVGDFHQRFLARHSLAIACPKLDANQEVYIQKLVAMIDQARIKSLKVMVMEVPCCGGLVRLVQEALHRAQHEVPVECLVIGTQGALLGEHRIAG